MPDQNYLVTTTSVTPERNGFVEFVELSDAEKQSDKDTENLKVSFAFTTGNMQVRSQADIPEIQIDENMYQEMIDLGTRGQFECEMALFHAIVAAELYRQILAVSSQWWNPRARLLLRHYGLIGIFMFSRRRNINHGAHNNSHFSFRY